MECSGTRFIQTISVISSTRFNKVEDNYNLKVTLKQSSECPLYSMITMLFHQHQAMVVRFSLLALANLLYEHRNLVLVAQ